MDVTPVRHGSFVSSWWTTCKGNSWLQALQSLEAQNFDGFFLFQRPIQERKNQEFDSECTKSLESLDESYVTWPLAIPAFLSEVCMCNSLLWERPWACFANLRENLCHKLYPHFWQQKNHRFSRLFNPTLEARAARLCAIHVISLLELQDFEVVSGKRPMTCQAGNQFISDTADSSWRIDVHC